MTLIIRQEAADDVRGFARRMMATNPRTAQQFVSRVVDTFRLLEAMPLLGAVAPAAWGVDPAVRFMTLRRFRRFVIVYRPLPDGVVIVRVVEGRQNLPAVLGGP
jgi:plasmid stabilization system protein ParE